MRPRIFVARILGFRLHLLQQRERDREAESIGEVDGMRHKSMREADSKRHERRVSESGRGE